MHGYLIFLEFLYYSGYTCCTLVPLTVDLTINGVPIFVKGNYEYDDF